MFQFGIIDKESSFYKLFKIKKWFMIQHLLINQYNDTQYFALS